MKAQNKVLVVTGAGNGIGRELCLLLLSKQANVAGVDLNQEALAETQKIARVGDDRFKGYVLDITDKAKVEGMLSSYSAYHKNSHSLSYLSVQSACRL